VIETRAVVMERPQQLSLQTVPLDAPSDGDVVVEIDWTGISTGTERLLWSGKMPPFPGLGYPLIPGYESTGRVVSAGSQAKLEVGTRVFVPGAKCFGEVRGLFGGAAATLIVPSERAVAIDNSLGESGVLLALAATAHHALFKRVDPTAAEEVKRALPDLIVGHGVLGRLLARLCVVFGASPTVWETNPLRAQGATGYTVISPDDDKASRYQRICDASGDSQLLDRLIAQLAPHGELVLAGFYEQRLGFDFAPAFMREASIRIAAQWQPQDLLAVKGLAESRELSLDGLITHRASPVDAQAAYRTAFDDPSCLKMVLDWRLQ
jgi:3-hydroxyethyl bacteriochlorophyllide a dehydrogenase